MPRGFLQRNYSGLTDNVQSKSEATSAVLLIIFKKKILITSASHISNWSKICPKKWEMTISNNSTLTNIVIWRQTLIPNQSRINTISNLHLVHKYMQRDFHDFNKKIQNLHHLLLYKHENFSTVILFLTKTAYYLRHNRAHIYSFNFENIWD